MTPALEPLDLKELRDLAERAALTWTKLRIIDDLWAAEYTYIAAANPQVLLRLIQEREDRARQSRWVAESALAFAQQTAELAGMIDGPCPAEVLCGAQCCEDVGCIKLKADMARTLLAKLGEEGL
jgi:hypothetical protein